MLECWNTGLWDAGAMVYWENVSGKKIKKQEASFKNIIPIFQYSNVPLFLSCETFFYFTGTMYGAKTKVLQNPFNFN